ncbi:Transmembrane protein [Phytophthora megakarya]|uniref:Transmembrane protein n=1 Tax=Phytophthora megakarya TaxID=4795 RepID=A0A225WY68_9STRA|nr:Transmembrane protein [Phytophthora megakarya]
MTDLFLLVANEGIVVTIQYVSLGYNVSGFLVLIYEIRAIFQGHTINFKRLWFSYEAIFLGELLRAAPCSVDSTLKLRNNNGSTGRISLRQFGLLKFEDKDGLFC